jgi:hypothetical protein
MQGMLAIGAPEVGFKEHQVLPGLDDPGFAVANADLGRSNKSTMNLDGWTPLTRLRICRHRNENVNELNGEASSDIPEVVLERTLFREAKLHVASLEVCVYDLARNQS